MEDGDTYRTGVLIAPTWVDGDWYLGVYDEEDESVGQYLFADVVAVYCGEYVPEYDPDPEEHEPLIGVLEDLEAA